MLSFQIYDGSTNALIRELTGVLEATTVTVTSNSALLHFTTDSNATFQGWNMTWTGLGMFAC